MRAREKTILIVGAGPAGMMAAISAALRGASVILCEQLPRPGAKLLATGGGRCNITNTLDVDPFMERFGKTGRFMHPALDAMNPSDLRAFFASHGVPTVAADGFHVFPASDSSATVQQALWRLCSDLNIEHRLGVEAKDLIVRDNSVAGLLISGVQEPLAYEGDSSSRHSQVGTRNDRSLCNEELSFRGAPIRSGRREISSSGLTSSGSIVAENVVLATGGKSYPDLGATGSGYGIAARTGHTIVDPLPVLVPLTTRETWPHGLSGVSLSQVRAWIDLPRQNKSGYTGDMLFTQSGVSGPVILDLSRDVVSLLRKFGEVPIRMDLQPGTSVNQWDARFAEWQSAHGRKKIANLLDQHMPASLAKSLLRLADIPEEQPAASFSRTQRDSLCQRLTGLPLAVVGAGGFNNAMVTRGGVSLREVDPKTLQSRKVRGLFFAGEILDLDGPCGGFNLQWAFSSGWLAGSSASSTRVATV